MTFTCPRCGGHSFGSRARGVKFGGKAHPDDALFPNAKMIRTCQAATMGPTEFAKATRERRATPHSCTFTWPDHDDHLYFSDPS